MVLGTRCRLSRGGGPRPRSLTHSRALPIWLLFRFIKTLILYIANRNVSRPRSAHSTANRRWGLCLCSNTERWLVCGAQRAPPLPPVGRDTTVDQRSLSRSRSRRSRGEPERLSLPRACRGLSGVLPLCARGALAAPLASAHLLLPSLHTDGHGTRGGADCGDCGCGGLRRQGPTRVWPGSGRPALARVSAGPSRLHLTAHNAKPHSFRALPRCVRAAHMDTSNFTNNELECLVTIFQPLLLQEVNAEETLTQSGAKALRRLSFWARRFRASTLASVVQTSLVRCLAALRAEEADDLVDDSVVVQRQRHQHDSHALHEAGRDRRGREHASEHNG